MAKIRVLVYGTLKTGEGNFHIMEAAGGVSLGRAETLQPDFLLLDLGLFPAVVPAKPDQGGIVRGELFELDETDLYVLDGLEGFPMNYDRKEIPVEYGFSEMNEETGRWKCETCMAWMYFIRGNRFPENTNCIVCTDGIWYPRVRRECADITELVNPDYIGASADYIGDPYESYYELHEGPVIDIGVDGNDDLHELVDKIVNDAWTDLQTIGEDKDDDGEWDCAELTSEGVFVTVEGLAPAVSIVTEALIEQTELEELEEYDPSGRS